jgi:hypothetical protein
MSNEIIHFEYILKSLRTAIIFISGILAYEWLKILENKWNKMYPNNHFSHFARRKIYHFTIIFLLDLFMLYSAKLSFGFLL